MRAQRENPTHFQRLHSHRYTFSHSSCGCQSPWLSNQASFPKKFVGTQERDNSLLSLLGDHGDFDLAFFDVENRVSGIALRKELLSFLVRGNGSALAGGLKKGCRIE
jgi:hypothetical protein